MQEKSVFIDGSDITEILKYNNTYNVTQCWIYILHLFLMVSLAILCYAVMLRRNIVYKTTKPTATRKVSWLGISFCLDKKILLLFTDVQKIATYYVYN